MPLTFDEFCIRKLSCDSISAESKSCDRALLELYLKLLREGQKWRDGWEL